MAAWWLGEHANVATDEYAGTSGVSSADPEDTGLIKPGSGRVMINSENKQLSAGEVCAYTFLTCLSWMREFYVQQTEASCPDLAVCKLHRSSHCKPARMQR